MTAPARVAPDFPKFWAASAVSFVGDGMSAVALPLLAASLSTDPLVVASVVVARWLPWVLFALPVGALADSWDRRRAMWVCDLVRAGLVALLAVAVVTGTLTIPVLMVAGFLLTCAGIVFDSNSATVLPTMLGRDPALLRAGNARLMTAQTAALDFVGPLAGGVLFAWSRVVPLVGDLVSYLVSAVLLRRMRGDYRASTGAPRPRDLVRALPEGVRWLARHRVLRAVTVVSGGSNLASFAESAILVLFAAQLGLDAVGFSLLLAAGSVGALVGGAVTGRLTRWWGSAVAIRVALLGDCAGSLLLGLSTQAWMPFPVLALTGFTVMVRNVVHVSLRQTATPEHLIGRVSGVHRLVTYGAIPLGALAGGLVADAFGLRWALFFGSGVYALLFVVAVRTITRSRVAEIERG